MRVLFVIIVLAFSCKRDIPQEKNAKSAIVTDTCGIMYTVALYDSDAKEFAIAANTKNRFKPLIDKANYDTIAEIKTNDKTVIFKDIIPGTGNRYYDEDIITYNNLGFNALLNKHLVHANYYESEDYLLIDNLTAKIDTLIGYPIYSESNKNFISYYINPYNERQINNKFVSTGDIQVCITCNGELRQILNESYDFIPVDIKWKDNNTILVKAVLSVDYDDLSNNLSVVSPEKFIYKKIILKPTNN